MTKKSKKLKKQKMTIVSTSESFLLKEFIYKYSVFIVATASLFVNLAVVIDYQKSPFSQYPLWDAASYLNWAMDIVNGNWIGTSIFHQPPLYPYLLSIFILIFGQNLLPVYIFQAILGTLSVILVHSISIKITNNNWLGLIIGLLFALCGAQVFYVTKILSETTSVFLILITIRLLLSGKPRNSTLIAGFFYSLLLLSKPYFLLSLPFIIIHYFILAKSEKIIIPVKNVLYFLIPCIVILSSVAIRNYWVGKEFVLISSNGGENFFIGNNRNATGTYTQIKGISNDISYQGDDVLTEAQAQSGKRLSHSEASRYWFNQGLSYIKQHPLTYALLEWTKIKDIFSGKELTTMYILNFEKKNFTRSMNLPFINFYILFPFFFVGLIFSFKDLRRYYLIYIFLFINFINILLFFYDSRFMIVTMPLFVILSGAGLWYICLLLYELKNKQRSSYRLPMSVFAISLILLIFIIKRDTSIPSTDESQWITIGEIYYSLGRFDESINAFVNASNLNKYDCMPSIGISKAFFAKGYKDVAAKLFMGAYTHMNSDLKRSIIRDEDYNALREYLVKNNIMDSTAFIL